MEEEIKNHGFAREEKRKEKGERETEAGAEVLDFVDLVIDQALNYLGNFDR